MKNLFSLLSSLSALLGLWLVFDAGYRPYRVNQLRNRLFELRSQLFENARSGALGARRFNDPAYRQVRRILNSYIRFAHQMTLFRMLVLLWSSRWWLDTARVRADAKVFDRALASLEPRARGRILHVLQEAELAIVLHMLTINSVGFSIFKPVEWVVRLVHQQRRLRANLAREITRHRQLLVPLEQEAVQRLECLEQRQAF